MVVRNKHGIDELREDKWLDGPGSLGIQYKYVCLFAKSGFSFFFCVFLGELFLFKLLFYLIVCMCVCRCVCVCVRMRAIPGGYELGKAGCARVSSIRHGRRSLLVAVIWRPV